MHSSICYILLACFVQISFQDETQNKKFKVAVFEYEPFDSTSENAFFYGVMISDVVMFHECDMVVFPENTLTCDLESAVLVPKPEDKIIPYKNSTYKPYEALVRISEAAAFLEAIVVVNLYERVDCINGTGGCPPRGYYIYNTNVAFDRDGTVIARYRKFNTYDEKGVDKPEKPELVTFTTDFGVTFGMFTCFDILFKTPGLELVQKNVNNFIFPNRWYGELPFLTSLQIQAGWSYATNKTLYASGANSPELGSSGSGLYFGRKSMLSWMSETHGTLILIDDIPVHGKVTARRNKTMETTSEGLALLEDPSIPSSQSKELDLNAEKFEEEIRHNDLRCKCSIKYRKSGVANSEMYTYKVVAFKGKRRFGKAFQLEVAYCAVVLCTKGNCAKKPPNGNYPLIFDEIKIETEFKSADSLQMPNTLVWKSNEHGHSPLHTMNYTSFAYDGKVGSNSANAAITLKQRGVGNLITFGIYARKFD